jgi:hypothetical protein
MDIFIALAQIRTWFHLWFFHPRSQALSVGGGLRFALLGVFDFFAILVA